MKIIKCDNFGRESESDVLIAENVPDYWGKIIVEYFNERFSGDYSPDYFRLIPDDQRLYKFKP